MNRVTACKRSVLYSGLVKLSHQDGLYNSISLQRLTLLYAHEFSRFKIRPQNFRKSRFAKCGLPFRLISALRDALAHLLTMSSTFILYGGNGSELGRVRQLHPTSFEQFVKETLGHPAVLNVSRTQFHALPKEERDRIKRVPYVTPATFKQEISRRVYEEAEAFYLVALDIDDSQQAKPFYNDPDQLQQRLEGLSFAAYTTARSTPEAPRLRIFVHTAGLPLKAYPAAVSTVAQRLGLPNVTKESLVVVQPMYLPTIFRDSDPVMDHPLIASDFCGNPLSLADLTEQETPAGDAGKRKQTPFSVEGDDLDYLRPVVDSITLEDAKEALEHLDPDMVYNEWLEIAAALRHQFPHEPEATEAYEAFDAWSSKGEKYVDSDDTAAKWKSLRPNPKGRAPVTIRTIFHKAQEAGWESQKLSTKCYANTLKWLTDPARTGNELMAEGVKRIAATPLLSPLERGTLLSSLQDVLKAQGLKVLRTDLKKELQKLERQSNKLNSPKVTPDSRLPAWARGVCYVAQANEFFHRASNRSLKPEAFDYCYNVFLTEEDSANGKPTMLARDYVLNVAKIPRVDNYRYDPARPEESFITEGKQRFINTYLPTYPEPTPEDAEECGALFLKHIRNLIAEPEYQTLLVDWMAYQVQNPGVKIRWAVLLQGAQGCGKTFIAEAMKAVLGHGHVNMLDASLIMRDMFNGWAQGVQLVAVEEIRVVGHNRHEVMNKLKPCISNDTISIRDLHSPVTQTPNNTNYLMFTNHHDSLAVAEGDRRYFVLNAALQNKAQVLALGEDYFKQIFTMIAEKPGGLRAWFEEWKISKKFNPNGHAPVTRYLGELMKAAATPLTSAVNDAVADGDHPLIQWDLLSSKALKTILENLTGLPRFTDQQLASVLRELDFIQLGRFRVDNERHYLWARRDSPLQDLDVAAIAEERLKAGPLLDNQGETVDFSILE